MLYLQSSFFTSQVTKAFAPALSLAALVPQFPEFLALPSFLGVPPSPTSTVYYRSTCIPNTTYQLFDQICNAIITSNGFPSEVVNLQLAPLAVSSAYFPLAGNEKAMGHDILHNPARRADVLKTITSDGMVMAGPLLLDQGGFNMVGRLAVFIDPDSVTARAAASSPYQAPRCGCGTVEGSGCKSIGVNTTTLDGVMREVVRGKVFWGVVAVLFNFQGLLRSSGIYNEVSQPPV
jgi:hypothetical protein